MQIKVIFVIKLINEIIISMFLIPYKKLNKFIFIIFYHKILARRSN